MASELTLSRRDRQMLDGAFGDAVQTAMRVVTKIARIQGATELLDISHAHIGGSIYTGQGSLQVIETLARQGARVRVPTTINAISIDRQRWRSQGIDPVFAGYADRLAIAFEQMGANPVFSCTPYIFPEAPGFGQDIVWAESNAIAYANSVLGARTNRHGDFLDICAAITGRAPRCGLHLPENRLGDFLVTVPAFEHIDSTFYTALGYLIGRHAGTSIPVVQGLTQRPSLEDLKSFSATIATSGAVGLYHLVGITPEARTLEQALGGRAPARTLDVSRKALWDVWHGLSSGAGDRLDLVVMGSPHFTLGDCEALAGLVAGRRKHPEVDFLITTSQLVYRQATHAGWAADIERFGARFSTDTCLCMLNEPMLAASTGAVMTNSGKFAHYGPGLINRGVYFGGLDDCVRSAIAARPMIALPRWLERTNFEKEATRT